MYIKLVVVMIVGFFTAVLFSSGQSVIRGLRRASSTGDIERMIAQCGGGLRKEGRTSLESALSGVVRDAEGALGVEEGRTRGSSEWMYRLDELTHVHHEGIPGQLHPSGSSAGSRTSGPKRKKPRDSVSSPRSLPPSPPAVFSSATNPYDHLPHSMSSLVNTRENQLCSRPCMLITALSLGVISLGWNALNTYLAMHSHS